MHDDNTFVRTSDSCAYSGARMALLGGWIGMTCVQFDFMSGPMVCYL